MYLDTADDPSRPYYWTCPQHGRIHDGDPCDDCARDDANADRELRREVAARWRALGTHAAVLLAEVIEDADSITDARAVLTDLADATMRVLLRGELDGD